MTTLYNVKRVAPASCPACGADSDVSDWYAPAHGDSFAHALADAHRRFPEVYGSEGAPARHAMGFMRCAGCGNITLRVGLGERLVRTREEAERLVEAGYTAFVEVEAHGDIDALIESHNALSDGDGDA